MSVGRKNDAEAEERWRALEPDERETLYCTIEGLRGSRWAVDILRAAAEPEAKAPDARCCYCGNRELVSHVCSGVRR